MAPKPIVGIWQGEPSYNSDPPFHPHEPYPEYPSEDLSEKINPAYEGVRESMYLLGLDRKHFGSAAWNPLGELVEPGNVVTIKPNFVVSRHRKGGDLFSIVTHPSIIRAVIDYVYLALQGNGKIIIADSPQMDCDFRSLLEQTQLARISGYYQAVKGFPIEILDLREFWLETRDDDDEAYQDNRHFLKGDPLGDVCVNLGRESMLSTLENWNNLYGADYNRSETIAFHHEGTHKYFISRTILESDVVISVPKLKVHKKVGVTLNCKGLVGITTNKNCLIHYRLGSPHEGGDQYPDHALTRRERVIIKLQRFVYDGILARKSENLDRLFKVLLKLYRFAIKPFLGSVSSRNRILDGGNWHGNDSAWRMVVDLVRIAQYSDTHGRLHSEPQRKMFSFVDGIIGGDGDGPLAPDRKESGVVLAGEDILAVDRAAVRLMGFDWRRISYLKELNAQQTTIPSMRIEIRSNTRRIMNMEKTTNPILGFNPHPGWKGQVEI